MIATTPVLELKGILKEYPGVRAVNHASLELLPGEVHALVGENGAGKSTLIKIMAGLVRPDAGQIWLKGQHVTLSTGSEAYRLGLSFIHQELNLVPYLNGAENIFLGRPYPKTPWGTIAWPALYTQAQEILATLGVHLPVNVPVRRLSRGDQAMLAIARAFAGEASIFVMDEPTASLTDEEIHNLFKVIRSLAARGQTVLYVSHRLDEIFEICDRVTVMRDGSVVATQPVSSLSQTHLIRLMIGRSLAGVMPPSPATIGKPVLRVQDLCGQTVHSVSLTLRAGEILGLAGLVGAGRTNILRMIYGADPIHSGQIWLKDRPFYPRGPNAAIRQGIMLMPEERRSQGLILSRSVLDNITLPHLNRLASAGLMLNPAREQAAGEKTSHAVRLKATSLAQKVSQLSGGNQQKVLFARWLAGSASILLLDEPTRGVDVGARYEIYHLIRELTAQGIAILLVSSDLTELLELADRVIVMREGRQMAELDSAGLTQETVLQYCYGDITNLRRSTGNENRRNL